MITILTFYEEGFENCKAIGELAIANREEYGLYHGYFQVVKTTPYGDATRFYAVQRLNYLRDNLLSFKTPFVWVLNITSIITNLEKPVYPVVQDNASSHVWMSRDVFNWNAGSFIIRRSDEAVEWLDRVLLETPNCINEPWHEQAAIITEETRNPFITEVPQRAINSYDERLYARQVSNSSQWEPGDLVLSLPGLPYGQRLDIMRYVLENERLPSGT